EDRDEETINEYKELVPMFELMAELAELLRKKRYKRGSIDFDFPECKIEMDAKGKPISVHAYERNKATRIIEDFMLLANETVAEDFFWQELPFVYRTHESPDNEKITKLGIFINNFGYSIKIGADEIHPKELQKLILKVEGTPEETLISRLTLRSMKQAKYTTECSGHFGLATRYYCHFTSPIRRYPDLQIHRIIKENLRNGLSPKRIAHFEKILPEVAAASSRLERRADESEREVEKMKKVEYMEKYIGEEFEGVVSGVTSWGMYVELPSTIEGMIRISELPGDYYYFDEEHYCMVGEHTKRTFSLGERVKVRVVGADKLQRTIDFELVEEEEENGKGNKKANRQ
nr:RNB domain-containing ribonuclease [Lachnospiraceae bacterium]